MKLNKNLANAVLVFVILSLVVVQAGSDRARFGESRRLVLPSYSILDENAQPLISANGKYGFVASITDGSLISFNPATGKLLSSLVVGESVGPISMIESESQRLIAVPAANLPSADHPAAVSIVDATRPKSLGLRALLMLPITAQITPTTQALLSKDGKYCVIAASFEEPTIYSFNVETGALVSQFPLLGRPSEVAFYDDGERRQVAVASAAANHLSLIDLDAQGQLISSGNFTPPDARIEEVNNPTFSSDGRTLYIASASADKVFAFDVTANRLADSVDVEAPQRLTAAAGAGNAELLGITRIRRPANVSGGGVTILKHHQRRLTVQSQFTPPEGVDFSRANNVAFNQNASSAFIASTTGVLFAFSTESGELESYQVIGNELRRIYVSDNGKRVAAVRSNTGGDEVVITSFDMVGSGDEEEKAPVITALKPGLVEQGYAKNLRLMVQGERLGDGDALLINGVEVATEVSKGGDGLEAQLPRSLFKQTGEISVQVKRANGTASLPAPLRIVKAQAPVIDSLSPERVPATSASFMIRIKGKNFRPSSTIFIDGEPVHTQQNGAGELQAKVGYERARSIGKLSVEVRDISLPELVSNARTVNVVGPTIDAVEPFNDVVVAGDRSFGMKITGENFREGSRVEINGELVPASLTRRLSNKVMIATVPGRFTQEAKQLSIKVLTIGGLSNAVNLDARAPEIHAIASGSIAAGVTSARVDVRGENFRRRARVTVRDGDGQTYKIHPRRVRFQSSKQIIVTFTGRLKGLLAKPGKLDIQVVNPNKEDGVVSQSQALTVAGPEVSEAVVNPIEGDEGNVRLVLTGANFRRGAVVEFLKAGDVVSQQAPVNLKRNRISLVVSVKTVEALGRFDIRVVNPGSFVSPPSPVRREEIATRDED